MAYKEEDFLPLSGIQHFSFCRRQWALIHVEGQWAENYLTADGAVFHENAHDGLPTERRKDVILTRGMRVHSAQLGTSGACDVVEFHRSSRGVSLQGQEGLWLPCPIEYKRGRPGAHTQADALQLCAQAICLEEMLCCPPIEEGALYYGETRHRTAVALTDALRSQVCSAFKEMHGLYHRGTTPKVRGHKGCKSCSLAQLCLPTLPRHPPVLEYLRAHMEDSL